MSRTEKTTSGAGNVLSGLGALVGLVVVFGGMFGFRWAAGECTSAFLRATGRLDVDSFYAGREQDHLLGIGAYWALAVLYAAPALLTVCLVDVWATSKWLVERWARYAVLGFAGLYTLGVMSFAFDPSRSGHHTPLVRRYEEFSYEAADLVMAATWTMLVTAVAALGVQTLRRRTARIAVVAVAFTGSACAFALAFT